MSSSACPSGSYGLMTYNGDIDWDTYSNSNISFYYHRLGTDLGTQSLEENSTGSWVELWSISTTDSADSWIKHTVNLSSLSGTGTLRFKIAGNGLWSNDIAYDSINLSLVSSGSSGINSNSSKVEYQYDNLTYLKIHSINITTYVSAYNTTGSIANDNTNITLWLEAYNGSDWIDEGDFGVGTTQTTGNYTIKITTQSIINNWNTTSNQKIRIYARYIDYNDSTHFDIINWTGVWIKIDSEQYWSTIKTTNFTTALCTNSSLINCSINESGTIATTGGDVCWKSMGYDLVGKTNQTDDFCFTPKPTNTIEHLSSNFIYINA